MMKEMDNKKKIAVMSILILVLVAITVVSYAAATYAKKGSVKNTITTGTLVLELDDEKELELTDSIPTTDTSGISKEAYTFTVNNTGTEAARYRVSIVDDEEAYTSDGCSDKKIPWEDIRFSVTKNDEVTQTKNLKESDGVIDEAILNSGEEKNNYKIRVWIDSAAGNDVANHHFHAKVKIEAILGNRTDYETGA